MVRCPFHPSSGTGLLDFEGAGFDMFDKSKVKGEKDEIGDDLRWCHELVELYEELNACIDAVGKEGRIAGQESGRVKHLGLQVYVQKNKYALDFDAMKNNPATITRRESRSVVDQVLELLKLENRVCVTGQPGIGKTRGSMMHALQRLLIMKAAVMYVGYKSSEMVLFLPDVTGTYRAWRTTAKKFEETLLGADERVVALIVPPESWEYVDAGGCRILKFAENNVEKHFENWEKDGTLLATSMPSKDEVLAMTEVLWSDERTPFSESNTSLSLDEKEVVNHRMRFFGPVPRVVLAEDKYVTALRNGLLGANKISKELDEEKMYDALMGTYAPLMEQHESSAKSSLHMIIGRKEV